GLLKLHTRYGPPDCSPTMCGLCREVPISPVSRTHRSPAIESNHQLFEWVLPPLVIQPLWGTRESACPTKTRPRASAGMAERVAMTTGVAAGAVVKGGRDTGLPRYDCLTWGYSGTTS
ncbi:MAG: hypothetical protein LAQ69_50440, partial [Acidobacteriia bacterium]|nr:hypothetical protein [Terriglobia bacterium]